MSNYKIGTPPNSGDDFEVVLKDGSIKIVAFCPQQGFIVTANGKSDDWECINESDIVKYKPYYE